VEYEHIILGSRIRVEHIIIYSEHIKSTSFKACDPEYISMRSGIRGEHEHIIMYSGIRVELNMSTYFIILYSLTPEFARKKK
jgi:hypothetical protein